MPRSKNPLDKIRLRSWGEARLALLHRRGFSLTDIANDLGKTLPAVSRVNQGHRRSMLIEQEIADRLGLSLSNAFPEWYGGRSEAKSA